MRGNLRTALAAFYIAASLIVVDASVADVAALFVPLSSAQVSPRARIAAQRPEVVHQQFVGVNAAALAARGAVAIDLLGEQVIADYRRTEGKSVKRYTWIGRLRGHAESHAILVASGEHVTGQIALDGRVFEIRPHGDGVHTLSEVDLSVLPREAPPVVLPMDDDRSSARAPRRPALVEGSGIDTIDVLVVYTPVAEQTVFDIESQIEFAIAFTNVVFENSLVATRLHLVGVARTTYSEGATMHEDLTRVRTAGDGFMDEVPALRDELSADVVTLVAQSQNNCGQAYLMRALSVSFEANAFGVVRASCLSGGYVFAHELGHNMGAMHDRVNSAYGGIYPYSYGYRYEQPGSWSTIMSYGCAGSIGGCPWIPHYSSPLVTYNGIPTGISEGDPLAADNARTFNETSPTVASFRGISIVPTDAVASTDLFDRVRIDWAPPTSGAAKYRVYRADHVFYEPSLTWDVEAPPFDDVSAEVNIQYYYRVAALTDALIVGAPSPYVVGLRANANCGNGVVDAVGEECDGESCCNLDCTVSETGTVCRPTAHMCDAEEYCGWQNLDCPEDSFAPPGTPCTDDGNPCTDNVCDVSGTCVVVNNSALCDDGVFCNGLDYCMNGRCSLHAGTPCCYPTPACVEGDDGCVPLTSTTSLDGTATTTSTTPPLPSPLRCGRPVSGSLTSDPRPRLATDCLFILRAAVGGATCTPSCVCDLDAATGKGTTATDALVCLRGAIDAAFTLECDCPGGLGD